MKETRPDVRSLSRGPSNKRTDLVYAGDPAQETGLLFGFFFSIGFAFTSLIFSYPSWLHIQ